MPLNKETKTFHYFTRIQANHDTIQSEFSSHTYRQTDRHTHTHIYIYIYIDEGAVDHSTVTRWFKKFSSNFKNLEGQASLGRPKTVNFKATFKAIVSSIWRVSGKYQYFTIQ